MQTDSQTKDSTVQQMPEPTMIGQFGYYTVSQLSQIFNVPEHHFIARVRSGELNGQKIGKQYLISAEQFNQWVTSGNFNYRRRQKSPQEGD